MNRGTLSHLVHDELVLPCFYVHDRCTVMGCHIVQDLMPLFAAALPDVNKDILESCFTLHAVLASVFAPCSTFGGLSLFPFESTLCRLAKRGSQRGGADDAGHLEGVPPWCASRRPSSECSERPALGRDVRHFATRQASFHLTA